MKRWPLISSSVKRASIRFRAYLSGVDPGRCCKSTPEDVSMAMEEALVSWTHVSWTDTSGCGCFSLSTGFGCNGVE